jgi:hypothetical protein
MNWHLTFKVNGECFINRYFQEANVYSHVLAPIFQNYPEAKVMMVGHMKQNLNQLSTEMLSSYMCLILLPLLARKQEKEMKATFDLGKDNEFTVEAFFKQNGLTKLNIPTVYRWIRKLGFKYQVREKCYYADNHQKPENQKHQKKFICRYRKLEMRMYRWIQFTLPNLKASVQVTLL